MIGVRYSCRACGIRDAEVQVPERGLDESIIHWVEQTMGQVLLADHQRRSPQCRARTCQDVKIPVMGARVGDPTAH